MSLPTTAPRDFALLFAARIGRLFAYGFLAASVAYLLAIGIIHLLAPKLEMADVEAKPAV